MHKNNFDFIRFILAFTVVLAHVVDLSRNAELQIARPYFNSYISVTGFFIISGFLITKSYISTNNIKQYLIKRANRLLPAYITTITACALLLSLVSVVSLQDYFLNAGLYKYLFFNFIFMNFLHPCLPGVFEKNFMCVVNGALWTIKVEVGFYLVVPLLVYFLNRVSRKQVLIISIYIIAIGYKIFCNYFLLRTGNQLFNVLNHQLPAFMAYFICGTALHCYFHFFHRNRNYLLAIALPVFIIEYYLKIEILTPLALTCILFSVAYGAKFLNNFGKHGDISYGIYIYHFPLIQLCISLGFFAKFNPWLLSICILTIVISLALVSYNFLEKRFLQRKAVSQMRIVNDPLYESS